MAEGTQDGGREHQRDHERLAAALTPSRRSWMLQHHLDRFHAEYDVRVLPSEARAASLDSVHAGLHDHAEASAAYRLSVVKAIAEDLVGSLEWLRQVDAEAAEQVARRVWAELAALSNQILSGDAGARPELEG